MIASAPKDRRNPGYLLAALLLLAVVGYYWVGEWRSLGRATPPPIPPALAEEGSGEAGVHQVVDGVWVAIGYGLANSILLEGPDGVVIVDTLSGRRQAEAVLAAFVDAAGLPSEAQPVRAVILTHNHADHVFGAEVFTGGDPSIPVYAHATTSALIDRVVNVLAEGLYPRTLAMFGTQLPPESFFGAGIGPALDYDPADLALARPTHTVDDHLEVEAAGLRLMLVHAPGETPDQLFVWLPDRKLLLPGDNVYRAFPNLYTLRGTAYRDVMEWVTSLDAMRDLQPAVLVPSHTQPVVGAAAVEALLTAYRDAIQFVHDQTIRGFNQGETAEAIAARLRLPPHLAEHPWLEERYGTVAWSVRAIYGGNVGWFDGDPTTVDPLPPAERSRRWVAALDAGIALPEQARAALDAGQIRWAVELAGHWARAEPDSAPARELLAEALEALAAEQTSTNGYNYLATRAAELRGTLEMPPPPRSQMTDAFLDSLPIDAFLGAMSVRLRAEKALDRDTLAAFHFPDVDRNFTVHVRRGIAEVRERKVESPDLDITVDSRQWKRIAFGKRNPAAALAQGDLRVEGGLVELVSFLSLFER